MCDILKGKKMKRALLATVLLILMFSANTGFGAGFTVSPDADADCADLECTLESALAAAAENAEADTITLSAGTYETAGSFVYAPAAENFPLTIEGAGTAATILTGNTGAPILLIDTTNMADDANAAISVEGIGITNNLAGGCNNGLIIKTIFGEIEIEDIDVTSSSSGSNCLNIEIITQSNVLGNGVISGGSISFTAGGELEFGSIISSGDVIICAFDLIGDIEIGEADSISISNGSGGDISAIMLDTGEAITGSAVTISFDSDIPIVIAETPGFIQIPAFAGDISIPLTETAPSQNITIPEGQTINLDSSIFDETPANGTITWTQTAGSTIILSDPTSFSPSFVTPPVDGDYSSQVVALEYTIHTDEGNRTGTVNINIVDNKIAGFPAGVLPFKSIGASEMGIAVGTGGHLVDLQAVDPAELPDRPESAGEMPYGMLDFSVRVDHPGDTAEVTVYLPEPAPAGYTWFKYNPESGWTDFSEYAVFNADRTTVTLTLVDGGLGDDDGTADGVIHDPSGLVENTVAAPETENPMDTGSSDSDSPCFISNLF